MSLAMWRCISLFLVGISAGLLYLGDCLTGSGLQQEVSAGRVMLAGGAGLLATNLWLLRLTYLEQAMQRDARPSAVHAEG